jgi:integrase
MALGKQAKVVKRSELTKLLDHVIRSRHPERDRVIVLLSFKAGLRAKEIAELTWSMVHRYQRRDCRCDCASELGVER